MNRIILVGNGFDLAHNLLTSYKNFIEWFWEGYGEKLINSTDTYENSIFVNANITTSRSYSSWKSYCDKKGCKSILEFTKALKNDTSIFRYNSKFFESINKSIESKGWVDIENEYYKHLLNNSSKPRLVNDELESLKKLLVDYLLVTVKGTELIDGMKALMEAPFRPEEIAIAQREKWKSFVVERVNLNTCQWEYILNNYGRDINDYMLIDLFEYAEKHNKDFTNIINGDKTTESIPDSLLLPDRILLLNFNYTTVADKYLPDAERFSTIHIHGELSDPNSIIFGYGDEKDKEYNGIIDKNDNEYLRHMKQPHYSESDNYRQMLAFIESAPYQVYVMGHSCGNSDRTLLNTLFEHPNCVSIKPFYYVDKEDKDHYLDVVQNISRNFTDAKKMRDRVVNKMYCLRMPQIASEQDATMNK